MKTLVYFASGDYREEYQDLDFDRIYLIDNAFKNINSSGNNILSYGKTTCIGMDCLESVALLKKEKVEIDCFVSLNEGLNEGGGSYAINSDLFLGYVMPLLRDRYFHIMNPHYYEWWYNVSMDLPFNKKEVLENEEGFIDPFIFSKNLYHKGNAKVYQMTRTYNSQIIPLNPILKLTIVHDSIWNHFDRLDLIAFSFPQQGQHLFFDNLPKTIKLNHHSIDDVFSFCTKNKIEKVGFTPWARGKYLSFINRLQNFNEAYPKEIFLFHLNKNDYKEIKEFVGNDS